MTYSVKEIYYTLQGEGAHTGRPAVFCRFAGCNLWTGLEKDRDSAICQFCDTDFVGTDGVGGGKFNTAESLADTIAKHWPDTKFGKKYVVCTGGEPLLQVDEDLINAFHAVEFEIAVETNGTQPAPDGLDWICVSPKSTAPVILTNGDELKLVYPQEDALPELFENMDFEYHYLQPMDVEDKNNKDEIVKATIDYCKEHPKWRLSMQTHKLINIP